jgi:hypothetical protein
LTLTRALTWFFRGWLALVVLANLALLVPALLVAPPRQVLFGDGDARGFVSIDMLVVNLVLLSPAFVALLLIRLRSR